MWPYHVTNPYNVVLTLQLMCFFSENHIGARAQLRDYTCEVGQEKDGRGVWQWVLPYKDPCICTRVISGGMNTITPRRPFKPVYVDTPRIGDNIRQIRKHYNLNCTDIDECTAARRRCGGKAACIETKGSFGCQCKDGYIGDGFTCIDDDECMIGSQTLCDTNARCMNTMGSYRCRCNAGYELLADDVTCEDINECTDESQYSCDVNAKCKNTVGNYTCVCNAGYELQADNVTCGDIDECTVEDQTHCDGNKRCENTEGSYNCVCNTGYELQADNVTCGDINECTDESQYSCDVNAKCKNTVGNYTCVCNSGHELQADNVTCGDIDECTVEGQTHCDGNKRCENTEGSYNCVCNTGYELQADNVTCGDIDECTVEDQTHCDGNKRCENTEGSYNCVCNTGYELQADNVTCGDINECTPGTGPCGANGECENTNGSYTCNCNVGYKLNNARVTCEDINECTKRKQNNCDADAECQNSMGSYTCRCHAGYELQPDNVNCEGNLSLSCDTGWEVKNRAVVDVKHEAGLTMVAPSMAVCSAGRITKWTYQAKNDAPFRAIVFRQVGNWSTQFTIVGMNDIPAGQMINGPMITGFFSVPEAEQIIVQAGDVLGWSADSVLVVAFDYNTEADEVLFRYGSTGFDIGETLDFVHHRDRRDYSLQTTLSPVCRDYLGMKDGDIPDENITASSVDKFEPSKARLEGPSAWRAEYETMHAWIQADIGYQTYVYGVMIQGDGSTTEPDYITLFNVSTSLSADMSDEKFVVDHNGDVMIFPGNDNAVSPVERLFPVPIFSQVVRINCLDKNDDYWRMRFEILGCKKL